MAEEGLNPESICAVRRGRAGTFPTAAAYPNQGPGHLGRKCSPNSQGWGARRNSFVPSRYRDVSSGRHGRENAPRNRSTGRRNLLSAKGSDLVVEMDTFAAFAWKVQGTLCRGLLQPRHPCPRHSAATLLLCCTSAAFLWKQSLLVGLRIGISALIDRARLGRHADHPLLGAAITSWSSREQRPFGIQLLHVSRRHVVAATSEPLRVTNGMSQYSRHERNAMPHRRRRKSVDYPAAPAGMNSSDDGNRAPRARWQ